MSIEHNPAPLTDEEWERMPGEHRGNERHSQRVVLADGWVVYREEADVLRAAGATFEPPPAPRYAVSTESAESVEDTVDECIVATFYSEGDAETWANVLNGKAKIVYGGDA